jgi:RHS repeat-associated protein
VNQLHFTGKERDSESGNDYFGARYYNSNIAGRWLTPDWSSKVEPVPYAKLDNPQTLNLYAYVGNNPLSLAGADGHGEDSGVEQWYSCTDQTTSCGANLSSPGFGVLNEAGGNGDGEFAAQLQTGEAQQQLSANGLNFIEQHEGFRGKIYPDQAGHKTIGYGHKILPGEDFSKGRYCWRIISHSGSSI